MAQKAGKNSLFGPFTAPESHQILKGVDVSTTCRRTGCPDVGVSFGTEQELFLSEIAKDA
jgi:hypothetical protein